MNPYILQVARQMISVGGDAVLRSFEEGFKDARVGQYIDQRLKAKPESVTDENMMGCYKKYRAIMGTATEIWQLIGNHLVKSIIWVWQRPVKL